MQTYFGSSDNPTSKRLASARVSTMGQTLEAQLDQLKAAGCSRVYREKVSGARVDHKELGKLLKSITAGDQEIWSALPCQGQHLFFPCQPPCASCIGQPYGKHYPYKVWCVQWALEHSNAEPCLQSSWWPQRRHRSDSRNS